MRPYGLDGKWPDSYFKAMIQLSKPIKLFHLSIAIGSPSLCRPSDKAKHYKYALSASDAIFTRSCRLPWDAVQRALDLVEWWRNGSRGVSAEARYAAGAWASKNLVAYAPL